MQNKYLKHVRKCLNIVTKTITTKRLHTYSLILAKSLGGRCYPRFPYLPPIMKHVILRCADVRVRIKVKLGHLKTLHFRLAEFTFREFIF